MARHAAASSDTHSRGETGSRLTTTLFLASAGLMALTLSLIFFWVPTAEGFGVSHRIFYFHVPIAIIALAGFLVVAAGSIGYLLTGRGAWDSLAHSAAELGLVFASLALVTGVLWAKPVWGQWWTWDSKLTLTLILWFIYVAYLMVRAYAPRGSQGARYGSVVAIMGVIAAVLNYLATTLWRTTHPETNIGPLANELDAISSSEIYITFLVALLTFMVLYVFMLVQRYSLRQMDTALDELHRDAL